MNSKKKYYSTFFSFITRNKYLLLLILALIPTYLFLYKIYAPRVSAFGCFDDCFNYLGGYFILKGKTLYSEIFFNHQMLMAYVSYIIQAITNPRNIYELILVHRQFLLLYGFLMSILLVLRFRTLGFCFILFYEFSKYYFFGNRFLAEGIIVYPLIFLLGVIWYKLNSKHIYLIDYLLSAIFTWFIVFMREPYTPLVLFMYAILLVISHNKTDKLKAFLLFCGLTFVTLILTPLQDFIYQVVTINSQTVFSSESQTNSIFGSGIIKIFFYPIYLFFGGDWNFFRYFLISISALFLILFLYLLLIKKQIKKLIIFFFILGLANFRYFEPGKVFYGAFHMLPWYGLFLGMLFFMLSDFFTFNKKGAWIITVLLVVLFSNFILSPDSYIRESFGKKVDPHFEFITNFGKELQIGEVIKTLSDPKDTLFIDGHEDIIYWQAQRMSPYKYVWYTSMMPYFSKYNDERIEMFKNTPPDFYYGSCPQEQSLLKLMPKDSIKDYQQLNSEGKPTCLYIKKDKIPTVSQEQWNKAKFLLYELPLDSTPSSSL